MAHKKHKRATSAPSPVAKDPQPMDTLVPSPSAILSTADKLLAAAHREDHFRDMAASLSQRVGRELKIVGVKGRYTLVDVASNTTQLIGGYTHANSVLTAMLWLEQLG